jgi:SAM-dependent methyltransferase
MYGQATARRFLRHHKTLLHFGVHSLGRYEAWRDRHLSDQGRWEKRSTDELSYWSDSLQSGQFADLIDPRAEVQATCLRRALAEIASPEVAILDVGSGPLTAVGHVFPGKSLRIIPTDALADGYVDMLTTLGIQAPVLPIACSGEALTEKFVPGTFDIAFSQNALDHSTQPLTILRNMVSLIRPDGRVALRHFRNEGDGNGYMGLHFWNVDLEGEGEGGGGGDLVFWNRHTRTNVSDLLARSGFSTESWLETNEYGEHVHTVIRPVIGGS